MPQHLRDAAERRHQDAVERATTALNTLATAGEVITFASVARQGGVSTDFLYREPVLRQRIQELRRRTPAVRSCQPAEPATGSSSAVRALSAQIKELKRRHRNEIATLTDALAVAQGENLRLRRRLANFE
ncbi:transposase [Mycolicibacterium neoaurum]|uniref:DUF6262 family protein n=1 Tax=Mycolicibacterium neoaurum TaxID=1795 RepID=UPI001BCFCD31|nr:DUF6262 family protein [Mycolicibacterium neoaurum]QVI26560.1 transposase [Mycolicibacterium neoaurum]